MRGIGAIRRCLAILAMALPAALTPLATPSAHASTTGTISGRTFEDMNRNGVFDSGDSVLANQHIYLIDGTGQTYLGQAFSDASGNFAFTGLADASYLVEYAGDSATALQENWVPTTTGSLHPKVLVNLAGNASVNFGWRPIVRSTSGPLSSYTAPDGLVVNVYDDAANAQSVYQTLMTGSTVGKEASAVTISVDETSNTFTTTVSVESGSTYTGYSAFVHINWDDYLGDLDNALFHEYGIAWHLYYAYMVQQDPTLSSYLQARGLAGNPNLNSSWMWNQDEIFAEDYRELFGSPAGQAAPQMNTQIPLASQVPGLESFLASTYQQPPAGAAPTQTSPPPVSLSGLSVSPQPVKSSANMSFLQSVAATDTVTIVNAAGTMVKTLLASAAEGQGRVSMSWNRLSTNGKRVPSGSYTLAVTATDANGHTATATAAFSVS